MAVEAVNRQAYERSGNIELFSLLDCGIDDMEQGRELPLDDAFLKISELRGSRRNGRV